MTLRFAFFAAALFCATVARADAPPTPDPKQEEASLQSFGAANLQCREWNDGCSTCLRDAAVQCSTPGIACQPGPIVCSKSP